MRNTGAAALGVLNPRRMLQFHPTGTLVAAGAIAGGGVIRIVVGGDRSVAGDLLSNSVRAIRKAMSAALITARIVFWLTQSVDQPPASQDNHEI